MIGTPELGGQPHAVERLAVPFGMGAAVEALEAFLGVVAFLMADEHDAKVAEPGEAGADGAVVADGAVAVQLDEFIEDQVDVIGSLRPLADAG